MNNSEPNNETKIIRGLECFVGWLAVCFTLVILSANALASILITLVGIAIAIYRGIHVAKTTDDDWKPTVKWRLNTTIPWAIIAVLSFIVMFDANNFFLFVLFELSAFASAVIAWINLNDAYKKMKESVE